MPTVVCTWVLSRDDPFSVGGERKAGEAWRIDTDGTATQAYGDVGLANGIGFSPDGRRIYQSDSAIQSILVHTLDADGNVDPASREVFARVKGGVPDGLAVDTDGGVWTAVYGGHRVERFTPDGTSDRSIAIPAEGVTSLVFAGPGLADLIVVTADNTEHPEREGTIFLVPSAEVGARGLPAPLARI